MAAVPQPDQFSVLVRSIPKPGNEDESYSKEVEDFFQRFHPLHYLSHQMVFPASKLQSFLVCVLLLFSALKLGCFPKVTRKENAVHSVLQSMC
jgi:hypothetical protein